MSLPRMRTAAGVLVEIKAEDPNTEVTLHYIRQIIHTKQVPVVSAGRKKLVSVDAVLALLSGERNSSAEPDTYGQIRRIV